MNGHFPAATVAGRGFYPGWSVLAASFVNATLVFGATSYLFGLLVVPVSAEFGLSRADANNGYIVFTLGMTLFGPLAGWLIDRLSIKLVMPLGAALLMAGLVTIANSSSLWLIAAMIFGPVAFGTGLGGAISSSAVVSRWYRRRRGRVLGIIAMASSFSGVAISPISARLIEAYGWRMALMIIGGALACIIVTLAILVIRDRPSTAELEASGELGTADGAAPAFMAAERAWMIPELLRNRNFWLILFGIGLMLGSDQVLLTNKVPYMHDLGIDLQAASLIFAFQSGSAMIGKLLVGYAADRVDIRKIYIFVVVCHIALILAYIFWPGYWTMLVISSVVGIAIGGVYPVLLLLVARVFGSASFGLAYGALMLGTQPITILLLRYTGEVYDRTGAYTLAFATLLGCVCVSFALIWLVDLKGKGSPA